MEPENLFQILQQASEDPAQHGILVYSEMDTLKLDAPTQYHELFTAAKLRSIKLKSLNGLDLDTNAVILLHLHDHLDGINWFWAVVAGGGVPCFSTSLSADKQQRIKQIKGLQTMLGNPLVVTSNDLLPDFADVGDLCIKTVDEIDSIHIDHDTKLVYSGETKKYEDLAVLMLTSGSTGNAKAVCLRHGQIITAMKGKIYQHGTCENDVFMSWTGLDHVANLVEIHLHALYLCAAQIHVHPSVFLDNPLNFLRKVEIHSISYSFAPGFFLSKLLHCLEAMPDNGQLLAVRAGQCGAITGWGRPKEVDQKVSESTSNPLYWPLKLFSLRALISGGEATAVDVCLKLTTLLEKYHVPKYFIKPGFGMTETCAGSIYNTVDCPEYDLVRKAEFTNLGTCIRGIRMRIIRKDGTEAKQNEIGALQLSGPVVFDGYFNNQEATKNSFTDDGWFKTGDLALQDSNGRLRLAGRDKDTVVINGINHFPQAIESVIEEGNIPGVAPSFTAIFPHRLSGSGTEVLCVVYLPTYQPDDVPSRVDTAVAISKAVVTYSGVRPYRIIPLPASLLPKSSLGKLSRSKIRQAFESGAYDHYQKLDDTIYKNYKGSVYQSPTTYTEKIILEDFNHIFTTEIAESGINVNLFNIGFSSIDILKLHVQLQRRLGLKFPITIFFSHPTIRDLASTLDDMQKQKSYDPVVVLQPSGDKTSIWFIHPGVGEVLIFTNLSRYITDRPVYAIRARGFDGEAYFSSMHEVISTYHSAIKRVQPNGPYAIMGYSFGGILGFEITKIMEARGDKVQFLATLDQPPFFKERARTYDWCETVLTIAFFLGLIKEEDAYSVLAEMRSKTRDDVLTHIFDTAAPARVTELGMTRERLDNWARLAYQLKVIAWDYDPSGSVQRMDVFYTGPLVGIVKAKDTKEWFEGYISKWGDFVSDCGFHEVEGTHRTLISPPNLKGFWEVMKEVMEMRGI